MIKLLYTLPHPHPLQTLVINRSSFVLSLLDNNWKHKLGRHPHVFLHLLVVSPQVGSRTNKQPALFVFSLESQFLPLNVYAFQHLKNFRTKIDGILIFVCTCALNVLG